MDAGPSDSFLLSIESYAFASYYRVMLHGDILADYQDGDTGIVPIDPSMVLDVTETLSSGGHTAPTNPKVIVKSGDCSEPPPMGGGNPDE